MLAVLLILELVECECERQAVLGPKPGEELRQQVAGGFQPIARFILVVRNPHSVFVDRDLDARIIRSARPFGEGPRDLASPCTR